MVNGEKIENLEIIYSDDEDDIIDKIYFLCDISELEEETVQDLDIKELLKSNTEDFTDEKTVFTVDENIVKNEIIGDKVIKLIKMAIKNKIPEKFIFYDKEGEIVNLKKILKDMDSRKGIYHIIRNYFKINPTNYLLIYYLSNYLTMDEKELMDNLNAISNITEREFDNTEKLKEYDREVSIIVEENIKLMKKKLKRINAFYKEINELPFSNQPEDIERTLNMEKTEIEIFVRDGEYPFDIDSGAIVFDNIKPNSSAPFIVYISFFDTYYKISEGNRDLNEVMDEEYKLENKQENHIYIYVIVMEGDIKKTEIIDLDLIESKISFSYPGSTLNQIKDIIQKIFPNIVYIDEKKTYLKGSFEIDFLDFSEIRVRYLTLMDDMFSNFIYINENASPRSLKKNTKYYFKTYEDKNSFSNHSVSFTLLQLFSNRYLVDFSTKIIHQSSINEFILILSKLISYYNTIDFDNTLIGIVEERYIGEKGIGLGGEYVAKDDINIRGRVKKIDNLRQATGMFPTNYYGKFCPCVKQPIIIDNEDVKYWEDYRSNGIDDRNVVLFPPKDSKQRSKKYNFVCPEDTYPYFYLIKNPKIHQKYPVIPCCGITKNNDYIDDYDEIRNDEIAYFAKKGEGRIRKEIRLTTIKILSTDQTGVLPSDLLHFLNGIRDKVSYIRRGVIKNNTSSLIHCLFKASEHLPEYLKYIDKRNVEEIDKLSKLIEIREEYLTRDIKEKDILISGFRSQITNFVNASVCAQETYQYDLSQVEEYIKDRKNIFDSLYYYRLLETIFMVNIFVFSYEDGDTILEKPNHNFYHIRNFNEHLPTLLLFKHISRKSIPIYELIEVEKEHLGKETSPYLRGKDFLKSIKSFIETKNYTVVPNKLKGDTLKKNAYNGVNWNMILGDYKILSQDINDSGRMIKVNILSGDGIKISIFTKPAYPLNVKISRMVYEIKKEEAINIFGEEYTIGSEGLWYKLKNFVYGVFIPCRDIRELNTTEKICYSYVLLRNNLRQSRVFHNIGVVKKNANIIKQIILWLWNISPMTDVDEWFEIYVETMTEKKIIDIINVTPIKIDYRFPNHIRTTEEGISYYEEHYSFMFNLGKIRLYEKLITVMKQYIKNYQYSLRGYPKTPNKSIIDIFSNEKDFRKYTNTKIIIGKANYEQYYSNLQNVENDIEIIKDEWSVRQKIFNYRSMNDSSYFLIQNTVRERKLEAILGCLIWMVWGINIGYNFSRETVWKMFPENRFLLDFFTLTEQEIIDYSNRETSIETKDYKEALYYLSKNMIPIPKDNIDRIYSTVEKPSMKTLKVRYRNSEGIYNEYIFSRYEGEINVWEYGNGAYAIMLDM